MIICDFCGIKFENYQQYGGHVRNNHIDKDNIKKYERKFLLIQKSCPKCGKTFEIKRFYRKGKIYIAKDERKFCTSKCANSHIQTEYQNISRRNKLRIHTIELCKGCSKKLLRKTKTGYCRKCFKGSYHMSDIAKKKQSESKINLYNNFPEKHPNRRMAGIWNKMTYPEKLVSKYLSDNNIKYEHNKKILNYYPDFIIFDNIIIEVDGERWHSTIIQKEKDRKRDECIKKLNYKIYRIPAKNVIEELEKILFKINLISIKNS